ncbi:MAG: hypothetical protein EBS53_08390 [Bacteroidetes bacterium]|nr:hypothetical protein [Bacteroidota bacterium]
MNGTRTMIHLVSFATPQFRHRQIILGLSGRLNRVVDTVTDWTPRKLQSAGFQEVIPEISLKERGAGFWSWKPFIIQKRLNEVPEGDVVLYCDVGRIYPFKLLDQSVEPFVNWMLSHGQEIMPGIEIPWDGPISQWTKRDALVALDMDREEILEATPIQASFSIWRAGSKSRDFAAKWMGLCSQRKLISDDPSICKLGEHPGFQENRHDQALLSLLCMKEGLRGVSLGQKRPPLDSRNPSEVSRMVFGGNRVRNSGRAFKFLVLPLEVMEQKLRPPVVSLTASTSAPRS